MPENVDRLVTGSIPGVGLAASASLACGVPFSVLPQPFAAAGVDEEDEPWTGELHAGETVALIEDIVDTGCHALGAVERINGLGARVVGVLSIIDLEGEGVRLLSSAAHPYDALFRLADLRPC